MKTIRKFWGVALVVVLLSSLCMIGAAPASAVTPLGWNLDVSVPTQTSTTFTLYASTDIMDFSVSPDGMTVYAALRNVTAGATDNAILMKSINGGTRWTDLTSTANNRVTENTLIDSINFVASSPDNPDVVVIVDSGGADGNIYAAASVDGGLNFYDMGTIAGYGGNTVAEVFDLDVSPVTSGNIYYCAIAGSATALESDDPALYYFNLGATVGTWRDAVDDFGNASAVTPTGYVPSWAAGGSGTTLGEIDNFKGCSFSTNFASDGSLIGLSEQIDDDGATVDCVLRQHVVSIVSHAWDLDLALNDYPVDVVTVPLADGPTGVNAASVGLGPDFIGIEEETLITFVGCSITDTANGEVGGLYRVDESADIEEIRGNTGINSIDYDGTTVVAGAYLNNNVYRVTSPLAGSPSASSARSLKRIGVDDGGNDMVIVHFAGETIFGSKRGAASGLSKSTDLGNTWNDFNLMDSAKTVISDFYHSADGSVKYVAAHDNAEASIYRIEGMSSQRVLCVSMSGGSPVFGLEGLPDDPDIMYAYDTTGTDIYQTNNGGISRWSRKTTYPGGAIINALAAESASVVYAATGRLVYKSTNSGSGWNTGVDTLIDIFSMNSLGEGQLIVGGTTFYVGWSTDGGATWTKNGPPISGANFYVAASGLTADDWFFAAPAGGADVYRAQPAPGAEFKTMNFPGYSTVNGTTMGMTLFQGILYVIGAEPYPQGTGSTGVYLSHSSAPTIPAAHTSILWGTQFRATSNMMTAPVLTASLSGDQVIVSAPQLFGPSPAIQYFIDIVSLPANAPALIGPADGTLFKIVSSLAADSQLVNFTWTRADPAITAYSLFIALDPGFTESIVSPPIEVSSGLPGDTVSYVVTRGSGLFDPGRTYYWKVSPKTPFNGASSEVRSITIEPSTATVPDILAPMNGATVDTTRPAFSWGAVTGATMYEFQLSELPGFETTIYSDETASAGAALPVTIELERGKTYFWRVRALQPIAGDWSVVGNFMIAMVVETTPQVTVTQAPAVTFTMPAAPAATTITVEPPAPAEEIAPAYIWAIIIIGAILVIAVIVLIVRTRRSV